MAVLNQKMNVMIVVKNQLSYNERDNYAKKTFVGIQLRRILLHSRHRLASLVR